MMDLELCLFATLHEGFDKVFLLFQFLLCLADLDCCWLPFFCRCLYDVADDKVARGVCGSRSDWG